VNGADTVKPRRSSPISPRCARAACSTAVEARDDRAGLGQEQPAGLGQLDAAVGAVEQPRADRFLQRADLLAERWLGDAEPFGGAAEVQFLGDGDEIVQLAQFHGLSRKSYQRGRLLLSTAINGLSTLIADSRSFWPDAALVRRAPPGSESYE
jgi:hypothetical protein